LIDIAAPSVSNLVMIFRRHFRNMTPGQDARVGPENSCSGLSTISENGLAIPEPQRFAGHVISSRLYCSPKALWKLNWFLRDFGYDAELRERDEVDEKQLVGLRGVIKISHIAFNGSSLLRFDGFAQPAAGKNFHR
jgi:hypothetical protein